MPTTNKSILAKNSARYRANRGVKNISISGEAKQQLDDYKLKNDCASFSEVIDCLFLDIKCAEDEKREQAEQAEVTLSLHEAKFRSIYSRLCEYLEVPEQEDDHITTYDLYNNIIEMLEQLSQDSI
jgi:predicted CopG family antitoxin